MSKPIIRFKLDENNERCDIKEYTGIVNAGKDMKCSTASIHSVLRGSKKTSCEYYWEYVKIIEDERFKNRNF